MSMVLGTAGLWVAAAVSVWMAFRHPPAPADPARLRRVLLAGVAAHLAHAAEEYVTGFPQRFPSLLGLAPWPDMFFVTLNAAVVIAWIAAAFSLATRQPLAYAALWFFAIAGVMNGVAHPLLAVMAGGYFPGLVTSPAVAVAGALIWRQLDARTVRR